MNFLVDAGKAYAAGGYMLTAEGFFRAAMEQAPGDPAPYVALVKSVYGPDRDMQSAKAAMDEAAKVGNNDPYDLDLALADAAREAGDTDAQESALKGAVAERPEGGEVLLALGEFYLSQSSYDRAALTLQQAVDADPTARAYFDLGHAHEGAYNYDEAEKAYEQAAELDPGNRAFTTYYADFKRRIAKAVAAQTAAQSHGVPDLEPSAAPTSDADN